jgi:hypothetical protein
MTPSAQNAIRSSFNFTVVASRIKQWETPITGGAWPLDQAIENGLVAPMVSVMPSAERSDYMNFKDGSQKWEDFIMKDLLTYMRKNFNISHALTPAVDQYQFAFFRLKIINKQVGEARIKYRETSL